MLYFGLLHVSGGFVSENSPSENRIHTSHITYSLMLVVSVLCRNSSQKFNKMARETVKTENEASEINSKWFGGECFQQG